MAPVINGQLKLLESIMLYWVPREIQNVTKQDLERWSNLTNLNRAFRNSSKCSIDRLINSCQPVPSFVSRFAS